MKKKVILGICGVLAVAAVAAGSIAIGTSSHEYELGASMKDVPDGKIMAKVDGEPIYQKDVLYQLEQQKLEKKNNCLSIEKMKNDDLQTAKEMLASFDPLIDSDKEALDLCIRGKVILKECEKLGILPTIEECIKEQQQIYQDVKARMKSDVDIERVTAQYAYQFFHDTAQGYGITDDEMIKTHSAKSYQLFKSSGNLYEYFLANVYTGEQSDADSVKQAYEQYFDQLKSSHKVEYLVKLRTKKNTVPGLVIPSVPDTASSLERSHADGVISEIVDTEGTRAYRAKSQPSRNTLSSFPITSTDHERKQSEKLATSVSLFRNVYQVKLAACDNDLPKLQQDYPECVTFYQRSQEIWKQYEDGTITVQQALDDIRTLCFSPSTWETQSAVAVE